MSRKSSTSRKYLKTFSPVKLSWPQINNSLRTIQNRFLLQICLNRKLSKTRTSSKTVLPGKMSLPQIINIPEMVKDFFARKNLTTANHLYLGVIQENFHLQSFVSRKSSISRKYSEPFSPAKLCRTQIIKMLRKSSISRKHSRTSLPSKLS